MHVNEFESRRKAKNFPRRSWISETKDLNYFHKIYSLERFIFVYIVFANFTARFINFICGLDSSVLGGTGLGIKYARLDFESQQRRKEKFSSPYLSLIISDFCSKEQYN